MDVLIFLIVLFILIPIHSLLTWAAYKDGNHIWLGVNILMVAINVFYNVPMYYGFVFSG